MKNLTSRRFQDEFDIVLNSLEETGYNNYYQVLNAKDFGIPQNRERVFIVSIRKNIDNGMFKFPKGFELKLRLKDMLEDEVEERYYLSRKVQSRFNLTDKTLKKSVVGTTAPNFRTIGQRDLVYQQDGIIGSLVATDYKQPKQILETKGNIVLEPQIIREKPLEILGWHRTAKEVLNVNGICRTLSTQSNNLATKIKEQHSLKIRKLTPLECFRLMGFDDDDFNSIQEISNTQLYKMAGNSIVVDVLKHLFIELFKTNILEE